MYINYIKFLAFIYDAIAKAMYIPHILILLLYPYVASFGVMAFSTSFIFLLVLTAQLALCQQQQQVTVTHIRAGNGSGSLTDYLHTGSLQFPSFTTLLFSPGVHDMCEERVVVIRDVTSIALIGSDSTHTRSVQVGGGKVVEVTEPSTVVDCHGCPTGFAFVNVSIITFKQIQLVRCGGKGVKEEMLNPFWFSRLDNATTSSLTLVSVQNLSLETVMFKNTGTVYSIIAVNIQSNSHMVDVSVLQEMHKVSNLEIYPDSDKIIGGNVFLSVSDIAVFSLISMNILHSVDGDSHDLPVFTLDLTYLYEGKVQLIGLNVHVKTKNEFEPYILMEFPSEVSNYHIIIQKIRLTTKWSSVNNHAIKIQYDLISTYAICSENRYSEISDIDLESKYRMEIFFYGPFGITIPFYDWQTDYYAPAAECFHTVYLHHCQMGGLHILGELFELPCYNFHFRENTDEIISKNVHIFISNSKFSGNTVSYGDEQRCKSGGILAAGVNDLFISNCIFANNMGSGLYLIDSTVIFSDNNTFYNNTAEYGGGILIDSTSFISIYPSTKLNFTENIALITGGAIHVEKHEPFDTTTYKCFLNLLIPLIFDIESENESLHQYNDTKIVFDKNRARIAGSAVWGGSLDTLCKNYLFLFNVSNDATDLSALSSSPTDLCYCSDQGLCLTSEYDIQWPSIRLFPGSTIEVRVAITGQMNGLVPGLVQAQLISKEQFEINELQRTQRIRRAECTALKYTLHSESINHHNELRLRLPNSLWHDSLSLTKLSIIELSLQRNLKMNILFIQCPVGFQLWPLIGSCNCLRPLIKYTSNAPCDINTQTVERTASLWMNASYTGNNTQTLAVHQHCPFDYCDPNKLRVDLSSPDQQCAHNRSGILCGGCTTGLSLTLGSPKCRHCSNNFLSLLLAFAAAGLALVAVLTCLNLTVSVGTINALILYANIVRALHPVFFPSTTFLSVFVAWLNLDIGLESCFYDGLDFYSLTWLQFVFPVYIWLLVGVMILTSHYSTTAAKLVSRDAVKVLATLFLLSYAKLLRTILTVLSFTYISYEDTDGATHRTAVWLYDGNVEFGRGKHIPLILAALSFGVLYIIPFTVLLLLAPFLQTRSHYTALRWVNKLMPFLDAYQGPYSKRFRFWPGALLLVRVALFVSLAANAQGDPRINLIIIITILVGVLTLLWVLGTVYEFGLLHNDGHLKNILEVFYILNIILLSTWSLVQIDGSNSTTQTIITSVLVGLAFFIFICTLGYHAYSREKKIQCFQKLLTEIKTRIHPSSEATDISNRQEVAENQNSNTNANTPISVVSPTTTFIELREPVLTDQ